MDLRRTVLLKNPEISGFPGLLPPQLHLDSRVTGSDDAPPREALSAEIKALQAENDRMRTALEYIAGKQAAASFYNPAKWINEFCDVARVALGKMG